LRPGANVVGNWFLCFPVVSSHESTFIAEAEFYETCVAYDDALKRFSSSIVIGQHLLRRLRGPAARTPDGRSPRSRTTISNHSRRKAAARAMMSFRVRPMISLARVLSPSRLLSKRESTVSSGKTTRSGQMSMTVAARLYLYWSALVWVDALTTQGRIGTYRSGNIRRGTILCVRRNPSESLARALYFGGL
jgi:hypothetical protein